MNKLKIILAVFCIFVCVGIVYSQLTATKIIPSQGSINVSPGLGVYSDSACQNSVSIIDWGVITPGQNTTNIIYVKNVGVGASLILNMTISEWNPTSANDSIVISWNQEGAVIGPDQSIMATLTITVSPLITGISSFSNQITLTGTQFEEV